MSTRTTFTPFIPRMAVFSTNASPATTASTSVQDVSQSSYQNPLSSNRDMSGWKGTTQSTTKTDFENKLSNWPKIGANDAQGIQEFGDFLQQVRIASQYIPNLKIFEFPSELQATVMVQKQVVQ